MSNAILTEQNDNGILIITLNRPDKLNALNAEVLSELSELLNTAKNDSSVKALLITGNGKAFCAGADIQQLQTADNYSGLSFAQQGQHCFNSLENLGKPSIAAINGYAFGGGCELAMAASIRLASKSALFGQPEVKLGVIPGYGGTQRLARLVGKGRAIDLCITGKTINANEALQWGLVSELTEPENLMSRAIEILRELASLAPLAIRSILHTINTGFDLPQDEALRLEATQFAMICGTKDSKEGIAAFLEKRPAEFTGE